MTLKVRRILSSIFILLFLIIAPATVLYAAGFRLSKNGRFIQKTGLLIIDSKPENAKIFINGQPQKNWLSPLLGENNFITTPAKIKNLLPGDYDFSVELNGYSSWQKKLTIYPGASTAVKDIYLFKNSLPAQIVPADTQAINFSPDKNQTLIISAGRLILLNLQTGTERSASQSGLKGKSIAWSADGQRLVIDNYLYSLDDLNSRLDLSKLTAGLFNFQWSDNTLFYQDKSAIYQLDQNNLPKKIVSNANFNDYLVKDGYLFLINKSGPSASLKAIDLATNQQLKNIALPAPADYSFINPGHSLLNLYDNTHKTLYLFNPLADYSPLVEIINNVKTATWFDGDNLLYAGDYEIWLYNLASKNNTLITRISDTVNQIAMYPSKNYIIYSTGQTINAMELDERGKRNVVEFIKFDYIKSFALNPQGDVLYFSGRSGGSGGLYKLLIQ